MCKINLQRILHTQILLPISTNVNFKRIQQLKRVMYVIYYE